jgi:hypothetical protein
VRATDGCQEPRYGSYVLFPMVVERKERATVGDGASERACMNGDTVRVEQSGDARFDIMATQDQRQ